MRNPTPSKQRVDTLASVPASTGCSGRLCPQRAKAKGAASCRALRRGLSVPGCPTLLPSLSVNSRSQGDFHLGDQACGHWVPAYGAASRGAWEPTAL